MLTKRGDRTHMVDEAEFEMDRLKQQVCSLQQTVDDKQAKTHEKGEVKQTKVKKRTPPTCYHCGYMGHVQRWCPKLMPSKTEPVPMRNGRPIEKKEVNQENCQG